jgi:glutamyl-tRNA synthetase
VEIAAVKIQTLAEFWPLVSFLFDGPAQDAAAFERVICAAGGIETLTSARQALADTEPFTMAGVERALRGVVERRGAKPGQVFQPVRVAIAGGTVSPGIFESVAVLGREETLQRIDRTLERARRECNGAA